MCNIREGAFVNKIFSSCAELIEMVMGLVTGSCILNTSIKFRRVRLMKSWDRLSREHDRHDGERIVTVPFPWAVGLSESWLRPSLVP